MTADHEQHAGHGPDPRPQTQQTPIADRLITTYRAHQDLSASRAIYQSLSSLNKPWRAIDIAEAEIALGLNPAQTLAEVRTAADNHRSINKVNLYRGIARIQAEAGHFDTAEENLRSVLYQDNGAVSPSSFVDLGELALERGIDPKRLIDTALDATTDIISGHPEDARRHKIYNYLKIARFQKKLGEDPKSTLDKALEEAKGAPDDYHRDEHYTGVVRALADCGYFDEALSLAARLRDEDSPQSGVNKKQQIISYIGDKQAQTSKLDASPQTTEKSVGLDFKPTTEDILNLQDTEERTYALIDLAQAQENAGVDSAPTFSQAFESADSILSSFISSDQGDPSGMGGMFAGYTQLGAYKDIAIAALDVGKEQFVEIAIGRWDKYAADPDWGEDCSDFKIELLTKRAILRAKNGLSRDEIQALTAGDIHSILVGGNPAGEDALEYFGLSKGQN